jgi:hypothetical protein
VKLLKSLNEQLICGSQILKGTGLSSEQVLTCGVSQLGMPTLEGLRYLKNAQARHDGREVRH